ncbi:MAG: N-acyl-D-amino-acid deacylase family protein [Bacillota bacterium]
MVDLLIKNVTIIDGTGLSAFKGSLTVAGNLIESIIPGELSKNREERIDFSRVVEGEGLVLAPGLIDAHTHSDLNLLASGRAASKIQQGVTTEVIGNCGSSPAPIREAGRDMLLEDLVDFELALSWDEYPEFLEVLEANPTAVNIVPLIGHGAIRKAVAGYQDRQLTPGELTEAKNILSEAMEAGARGFSSGLIYPPSAYGNVEELIALAKTAADYGGIYTTHLRDEGCDLVSAVQEAIQIGAESGIPVHISHHKVCDPECWGLVNGSLEMMKVARDRGVDVTCDLYPYLATNTNLSSLLPDWAHAGGREALLERIRGGESRDKILKYLRGVGESRGWESILISELPGGNHPDYEGISLAELGEEWGMPVPEALLKLLDEQDLRAGMIGFAMREEDLISVLQSPFSMIGSDGSSLAVEGILASGRPHPRSFGTFPRVLGRYVREKQVLSLEVAVSKMTGQTAARFGLTDRGLIKPGLIADLLLFDPENIIDKATYQNPFQYPAGIEEVWVAGESVIRKGKDSGASPGVLLRR